MEPTASDGSVAAPGKKPPGRFLIPRPRPRLAWLLPSLAVHLLVLIAVLSVSTRPVEMAPAPLPRWALALTLPEEPDYAPLPPAPAGLPAPRVERAIARRDFVQPSPELAPGAGVAPGVVQPGAGAPAAGPTAPGEGVRRGIPGPRLPIAERLRPGRGDPRLWTPLPEEIVGLSPSQLAQLEIDLAIAEVMDSVTAAEAAGRRATDWTYTDSQGRRWGVSPGQIHLGGITIPLPFGFSAPRTADAMRRAREDTEIAAQAGRAEATAALRDRAAEIRRRRDAERARARTQRESRPMPDSGRGGFDQD